MRALLPTYSLLGCIVLFAAATPVWSAETIDFNSQIRPILSDRCFACHGPDEHQRQGGFRLDQKEGALGVGDSGESVITPGQPDQSELVARIFSEDDSLQMPPADHPKQLTAEEKDLLKQWVAAGADWQEHWSYSPVKKPDSPMISQAEWVRNPIDEFVLARLEVEGLKPKQDADQITLLRRVTLDLTGLPPTLEEIDAFLADESPEAYEKVVDRLLASPRFGEHRAHYWLDAVRFGDTHGLHLDNYREMWPYRDWVINAFNQNMPFDQFVTEQLAGDLLENPTQDQLIATGFLRCHVTTSEGGSIREEVYVRNVVDRVVTFGTVFLGATLDCTRCHDHKFDPLTMKDFYSLFAYFNSIDGSPLDGNRKDHAPIIRVPNAEQQQQLADYDQQLASLRKQLQTMQPTLLQAQRAWEQDFTEEDLQSLTWTSLVPEEFHSVGGATLTVLDDGSLLASETNPAQEVYEVISTVSTGPQLAVQLEGLLHESLTSGGTGRSSNSNVVLTGFEVFTETPLNPGKWTPVKLERAWADYEQPDGDFKIQNAIDTNPQSGWAIAGHQKKENRLAQFVASEQFGTTEPYRLKIVLKHESIYASHQFGRIRLSVTDRDPISKKVPQDILNVLNIEQDKRTKEQQTALDQHFREVVYQNENFRSVTSELATLEKTRQDYQNSIPTTMIFKEKQKVTPAFMLKRGEYDQRGDEVTRATPQIWPEMTSELSNDRLGLARWLTNQENPLTTRVTVNRFWQELFGIGLVLTAEDFGSQGESPSHPELLDWLAADFRNSGWDMKQFFKQIVMSSTYRQSSQADPEEYRRDPQNRLLARGPRFRMDAEMVRDQALFIAGLLVERIGGPSVKPPQPDGLWYAVGYTSSNTARFKADEIPEKIHRRTLYTFLKRTAPSPQHSIMDGPSRESSCVRRERTNTPLQALMLFNDPQFLECALGLAARTLQESEANAEQRARLMYRFATSYAPSQEQVELIVNGYQQDLKRFQQQPELASELINSIQLTNPHDQFTPEELAAWTLTANVLLSLDQVLNKN